MSTATVLDKLKKFLQEKVSPTIELQKADDKNIENYELVKPAVHVGWVPPKGYLPESMESAIPCLVVGMDEGSDDGQSSDIKFRISAAVFSPGLHQPVDDEIKYTPDFHGYIDLLNLIDRTKAELIKYQIIEGSFTLQGPVKWGMYQEQPYPYWYGWITFSATRAAYPRAEILKNL